MPYAKTKDGSLVNEVTLGDGYPLSNDLQPLKIGGEASPIEMSTSLPDDSDNAKVKVRGDLEVTGGLNFKNDVEVDLSFDDLSLSGDLDVTGDVTVDTDTLKVDATNNRVGIGTTSPSVELEVNGDIKANELTLDGSSAGIRITNDGGTEIYLEQGTGHAANISSNNAMYLLAGASQKLHFGANNTNNQMSLDDGKLGIGTTSPSTELQVDGTGTFKNVDIFDTDAGNNPRLRVGRENTQHIEINVIDLDNTIKAEQDVDSNGDHNFILDREFAGTGANNFKIQKGGSDQLVIDTNGNVGIGTTSPSSELHISTSSPYPTLLLESTGNTANIMRYTTTDTTWTVGIDYDDNYSIANGANITSARVFTILKSDGKVGIGTTSPLAQLHIEETSVSNFDQDNFANFIIEDDDARMQLVSNDGGSNGSNIIITNVDGSTHHNWAIGTATTAQNNILHIGYNTSTGDVGAYSFADLVITKDGNVGIGLTAPSTTLDVEGTVSYKHTAFSTAGPTDNVDVSDTTVLECDTSGGHLTIGGFSGGVQGQILYVVKTTTDLNRVILENNEGGGSQDIFLSSGADLSISLPSGIALYCNGSDWFALDK